MVGKPRTPASEGSAGFGHDRNLTAGSRSSFKKETGPISRIGCRLTGNIYLHGSQLIPWRRKRDHRSWTPIAPSDVGNGHETALDTTVRERDVIGSFRMLSCPVLAQPYTIQKISSQNSGPSRSVVPAEVIRKARLRCDPIRMIRERSSL
jgi:hypothetical protein